MKKFAARMLSLLLALVLALPYAITAADAAAYVNGANSVSASYKSGVYYRNLSAVTLTGDGRLDVLAVALSQLGYSEGDADGQFSGEVSGSGNYTEYNRNMGNFGSGYGGSSYPWCASFVSFCLLQSECTKQNSMSDWCRSHSGDKNYIWREVSCSKWASQLRTCGYFSYKKDYTPRAADLIFFTSNGSTESHIGLVLYVKDGKVYTIEGNTSSGSGLEVNGGGVYFKSYNLNSSYIVGYGTLPYKTNSDAAKIDYSGASPSAGLYVATTNKYVYENEGDTTYKWLLPKYAMFEVSGVAENGRLIATCTIGGVEVSGYIKNNTDRVIQLTVSPQVPDDPEDNGGNVGGGSDDNSGSGDGSGGENGNTGVTLSSISIASMPYKLNYMIGEKLKLDGLVLRAKYSDNSTAVVIGYTTSGFDSETEGEKTVTVSHAGKEVSFAVSVGAAVSASATFEDVASDAWYTASLDHALSYKMVSGNGDGTFAPELTVTRAQFVQMLANISGVDTTDRNVETDFTDVSSGTWYAPAIKWASDNNIVNGMGDNTFEPDSPLTREQMCVVIVNYIENYLNMSLKPTCESKTFDDDGKISRWARESVYTCQSSGLVRGVSATEFAPSDSANRASAATLLVNFHKRYIG